MLYFIYERYKNHITVSLLGYYCFNVGGLKMKMSIDEQIADLKERIDRLVGYRFRFKYKYGGGGYERSVTNRLNSHRRKLKRLLLLSGQ